MLSFYCKAFLFCLLLFLGFRIYALNKHNTMALAASLGILMSLSI